MSALSGVNVVLRGAVPLTATHGCAASAMTASLLHCRRPIAGRAAVCCSDAGSDNASTERTARPGRQKKPGRVAPSGHQSAALTRSVKPRRSGQTATRHTLLEPAARAAPTRHARWRTALRAYRRGSSPRSNDVSGSMQAPCQPRRGRACQRSDRPAAAVAVPAIAGERTFVGQTGGCSAATRATMQIDRISERHDLIVLGGGLTGLALAGAVGGAGYRVLVVERAPLAQLVSAPYDGRVTAVARGSAAASWPRSAPGRHGSRSPSRSSTSSCARASRRSRCTTTIARSAAEPLGHIVENRAIRTRSDRARAGAAVRERWRHRPRLTGLELRRAGRGPAGQRP